MAIAESMAVSAKIPPTAAARMYPNVCRTNGPLGRVRRAMSSPSGARTAEVMKNRLVPNHSLPSSHEAIVSSSGTSR